MLFIILRVSTAIVLSWYRSLRAIISLRVVPLRPVICAMDFALTTLYFLKALNRPAQRLLCVLVLVGDSWEVPSGDYHWADALVESPVFDFAQ